MRLRVEVEMAGPAFAMRWRSKWGGGDHLAGAGARCRQRNVPTKNRIVERSRNALDLDFAASAAATKDWVREV